MGAHRVEFVMVLLGGVLRYADITYRANEGNTDAKLGVCPNGLSSSMNFSHGRTIEVEIGVAREIWRALTRSGWSPLS